MDVERVLEGSQQVISELGSSLIVWVEAEQNDMLSPLTYGTSHKVCVQMQRRKSWFERKFGETLFERRIIGCVPKVSQCPTLVRNGKTYEYISMDNIQLI